MSESELKHIAFTGINDYVAALDELCTMAKHSLYVFENDFDGIGFNSEGRFNTLRHFLLSNPSARLHLLTHNSQHLVRFCPRVMMLLKQFSNNMHIYQTPPNLRHLSEPFAVADENNFVRRFHFDDTRGIFAKDDPEGARLLKAKFEEIWGSSRPSASATTLGL